MSALTLQIDDKLIKDLQKTAKQQSRSVDDIVQQLLRQHLKPPENTVFNTKEDKRTFGQHRGLATMTDDFNETLPDSFWLGNNE